MVVRCCWKVVKCNTNGPGLQMVCPPRRSTSNNAIEIFRVVFCFLETLTAAGRATVVVAVRCVLLVIRRGDLLSNNDRTVHSKMAPVLNKVRLPVRPGTIEHGGVVSSIC